MPDVALSPIATPDLPRVAAFLTAELNRRVPPSAWQRAVTMPWSADAPNHGFMLTLGEQVVGAYLAIYSTQPVDGEPQRFCNLAAWCVREEHRGESLRLIRAMLGQRGFCFTDLSPSGNVVALNRRLRFTDLDVTTALVPNLPRPARGVRVVTDPEQIAGLLTSETDRRLFADHRGAAGAHHVVLVHRGRPCYVVYRRDRRKGLPLFATVLHVGDREVFAAGAGALFGHLLLRRGVPFTLVEPRVTGLRPRLSFPVAAPRPRMYKSATLRPEDVGYLYSELVCLAW